MDQQRAAKIVDQAAALCRKRGVRFTEQRRQVLQIVCAANRPIGAYEILDAIRGRLSGAAPPTVYRALDFLLEQGLVHKLETLHAFVGCSHPDHPHAGQFLICSECGKTDELEDEGIAQSLSDAAASSGFKPARPVVELLGTCDRCSHTPERPVTKASLDMLQFEPSERLIANGSPSALDVDSRRAFLDLLFQDCEEQAATLMFVGHDRGLQDRFHRTLELTSQPDAPRRPRAAIARGGDGTGTDRRAVSQLSRLPLFPGRWPDHAPLTANDNLQTDDHLHLY